MGEETAGKEKTWDKLSANAKTVCSWIGRDTMAEIKMLEDMVDNKKDFDLIKAIRELKEFGVIEETTYLQELRKVASKKPIRNLLAPTLDSPITDEERGYLKAVHDLQDYKGNPSRFKTWKNRSSESFPDLENLFQKQCCE